MLRFIHLVMDGDIVGQALYLSDTQIGFDLEEKHKKCLFAVSETSQIYHMLLKI